MEFRIADTFTASLARLTGDEQKAVKTTAFDLQINPANPGMQFHKLDKAKDKNFWSVRVGRDVRLIVHRTESSLLLCYVDHHDKAYAWAERRRLETHPRTGAAQLVEIRETVREVVVPAYIEAPSREPTRKAVFADLTDDELLNCGVPPEWLDDARKATEDSVLELAEHMPAEAAEALLNLATGGRPVAPLAMRMGKPARPKVDPFEHPDAQRRFRTVSNVEELRRALDYPWDKWSIFLHPEQRDIVERDFSGPARVSGSAGTGKTIVALHRAVFLARANPNARVLLTTFSEILANALRARLARLISNEPRLAERLEVQALDAIGARLYKSYFGPPNIVSGDVLARMIRAAASEVAGHTFSAHFLEGEWAQIVDAWQLESWESYRDVARLGRKTRLREPQRAVLWSIFERVRAALVRANLITTSEMFTKLAKAITQRRARPFEHAVVDESQDIGVPHLRFFAALGAEHANGLFFAGDLGQRIFQQPFSWKSLGVDIRGRSRNLRVNYRTSHQIRSQSDRLLDAEVSDPDGNTEKRDDTISVFNGPLPGIQVLEDREQEIDAVARWVAARTADGVAAHEIGIFVRSAAEVGRARSAAEKARLQFKTLDERAETVSGFAAIGTMHLAKGLEFRAVVVMACDDEVIPLQERIESVADESDLEEVYKTERQLLYVACTRARDFLLLTSAGPASEFLDDLRS